MELFDQITRAEEIIGALISSKGSLRTLLSMVIAYEKKWEEVVIQHSSTVFIKL